MWEPLIVDFLKLQHTPIKSLLSGDLPAIVIQDFYEKKDCQIIVDRIIKHKTNDFQNGKLKHIGPFLMSYTTKKEEYFKAVTEIQKTFDKIFYRMKKPTSQIHEITSHMLPGYSIANIEFQEVYSPFIIRIHEKGKAIPLHKDDIRYEGKNYAIHNVVHQLSCILHLQETEKGGELILYDKRWKKSDERYRNIDFGYSSDLVSSSRSCEICNLKSGDLVIINPNYYHEVKKINGEIPRITLGMFLGIYKKEHKIVSWA